MVNASLHMMAAVVLLGYVAVWATNRPAVSDGAATADVLRRSRWLAWTCLAVLAVTGVLMLPKWHVTWHEVASRQILAARFGAMLAMKMMAVTVMVAGFIFVKPTRPLLWRLQLLIGIGVVLLSILLVR